MSSDAGMPVRCPVCGSCEARGIRTFTSREAASYFVPESGEAALAQTAFQIERLWGKPFAEQLDCTACGFGYTDPFVAGDAEFYDGIYGTEGYPRAKWEFDRTINALRDVQAGAGEAIEVGCGMGYFLDLLAQDIYPRHRLTGLDYNKDGLDRVLARGIRTGTPDLAQLPEKKFESAFLFQVLEHSDNVQEMFAALNRILKPGGHLFIAVPNPALIAFNSTHGSLPDAPPNHIGRWNRKAFEIMGDRHRFELRAFEVEPFSAKQALLMDARFSYLQRARLSDGLYSKAYARRRSRLGRAVNTALAGVNGITRLRVWRRLLARKQELGENNWVHFVKRPL